MAKLCAVCNKKDPVTENFNEVDHYKYYSTDPTSGEQIGPLCEGCFRGLGQTWPHLTSSGVVTKEELKVAVFGPDVVHKLVDPRTLPNSPPAEANCSVDENGVNQEAVKLLEEILAHFRTGRAISLALMTYYSATGGGSDGQIGSYRLNWKIPPGVNAYGISGATHQLVREVDDYLFYGGA